VARDYLLAGSTRSIGKTQLVSTDLRVSPRELDRGKDHPVWARRLRAEWRELCLRADDHVLRDQLESQEDTGTDSARFLSAGHGDRSGSEPNRISRGGLPLLRAALQETFADTKGSCHP